MNVIKPAHRELGVIESVRAYTYNDIESVSVGIKFAGTVQGFGDLVLGEAGVKSFIAILCATACVRDAERLAGMPVYALRSFSDWGAPIVGLEFTSTGRIFTLKQFCQGMGWAVGHDKTVLEERLETVRNHIAQMRKRIAECEADLVALPNDYIEWSK